MNDLEQFHKDLTVLVNKSGINLTEIPDYLVSEYLINCLVVFNQTMLKNKQEEDKKSKLVIV